MNFSIDSLDYNIILRFPVYEEKLYIPHWVDFNENTTENHRYGEKKYSLKRGKNLLKKYSRPDRCFSQHSG